MGSNVQQSTPIIGEAASGTASKDNTINDVTGQSSVKFVSVWQASLDIRLEKTARGSVVKHSAHKGPLYIQKAFYPEGRDLAHLYILHPPGGLVSGDNLHINIDVNSDAKVLITTPGAGRVYKARADKSLQLQKVTLSAGHNAAIEWLPLETILYPNANTRLDTVIKLATSATFIGWDICCLGLPACNEFFDQGCLEQCLQIEIAGSVKLRERVVVNDSNRDVLSHSVGFANRSVNALMVAGPFVKNHNNQDHDETLTAFIDRLREYCNRTTTTVIDGLNSPIKQQSPLCSVSLTSEFLLIRYLGDDAEQARLLFTQCWQDIRPLLLARSPCPPRIWST